MKHQPYDLIGDIHGHHDKLTRLLHRLGYEPRAGSYRHPEGRKVLFLGDYIDRGPKVRDTLITVRAMVGSGDALAIMGNHEYNAIGLHTPDGRGGWLREHRPDRDNGHKATLESFAHNRDEWGGWLDWMKHLPMFLDLGGLRAVHACWDAYRIERLKGRSLADEAFLHACATPGTPEHWAVENVLKGPEIDMPQGLVFHDKEGGERSRVRTRWWDIPATARVGQIAMPVPLPDPGDADALALRRLPNYGPDDKPVFFGHYWLPAHQEKAPLARNIACLDYSAAHADNPLVAYRWDGEQELSATKFITHSNPL